MQTTAGSGHNPVSKLSPLSFKWRALIGICVGALQATCFPPVGLAFLLPLCIAGFLFLLSGLTLKQAFRLGFLYGLAWFLGDLFWFSNIFGVAAVSLCAILAFFTGLFAALFVWMRLRLPRIPAWLLAALLWTGVEYYRSEIFILKFGWLGLGYAVINAPLLAAVAAWFGCYGLTFAIVAFGACLSEGWRSGRKMALAGAGAYVVWLLLLFIRLPAPTPTNPLHVRLVQANSEDDQSLYALSHPAPGISPDIIVWPEYSFVSDPVRTPKLWPKLARVAQENQAYLLFGAKDEFNPADPAGYWNTAFLLDPKGTLVGKHVKNHPVHFFRDGVPGTQARAMPTALGRLGVAICFDMDYPDVARRLTEDGAEVFLVPNDDPPEWGPVQRVQHRLLFQMRAAECGRWLARADVAGGTSVSAPNGQEVVRVNTTQPTSLDVTVGRETGKTLFIRGGWLFGPACFVAALALWVWAFFRSRVESRTDNRKHAKHRSDMTVE